jgi:hypothetical protein
MTAAPVVQEEAQADVQTERDRLIKQYTKDELVKIAGEMSIEVDAGATKAVIADAILAKTNAARANLEDGPGAVEPAPEETAPPDEVDQPTDSVVAPEAPVAPMAEPMDAVYLTDYKHLMFTVGQQNAPESGLVDAKHANEEIERWFERGYDIIKFMTAGHDPRGHRMIWVLKKVENAKYSESKILQRTLTGVPDPGRGTITGFQADAYISQLVREEGWELVGVNYNGDDIGGGASTGGVYIIWMLAR